MCIARTDSCMIRLFATHYPFPSAHPVCHLDGYNAPRRNFLFAFRLCTGGSVSLIELVSRVNQREPPSPTPLSYHHLSWMSDFEYFIVLLVCYIALQNPLQSLLLTSSLPKTDEPHCNLGHCSQSQTSIHAFVLPATSTISSNLHAPLIIASSATSDIVRKVLKCFDLTDVSTTYEIQTMYCTYYTAFLYSLRVLSIENRYVSADKPAEASVQPPFFPSVSPLSPFQIENRQLGYSLQASSNIH